MKEFSYSLGMHNVCKGCPRDSEHHCSWRTDVAEHFRWCQKELKYILEAGGSEDDIKTIERIRDNTECPNKKHLLKEK